MGLRLITGEQIRAARALTRIDQADLARRCGVSLETIRRLERTHGQVDANLRTLGDLVEAFRGLGVVFDVADSWLGVRLIAERVSPIGRAAPSAGATVGSASVPTIHRLIYCCALSFVDERSLDTSLNEIQEVATVRHRERGVSSVLVVCGNRALGVLEGRRAAVFELYGLMALDPSICDFQVVESGDVAQPPIPWPPMVCAHLLEDGLGPRMSRRATAVCLPETPSAAEAMHIIDAARRRGIGPTSRREYAGWQRRGAAGGE